MAIPLLSNSTKILLHAMRHNDAAAVTRLPQAADFHECQPTLSGPAIRALQQRPSDTTPQLATPMREAVLGAARQQPVWPILATMPTRPSVDAVQDNVSLAWFSNTHWQAMLLRFALGHHAGTHLASGNAWMQLTYLSAAILLGDQAMTQLMLAAAGDPNVADTDGHTPLWSACETNQTEIVQRLLDSGASVHAMSTQGDEVPLALDAVALANPAILRLLREHGADFDVEDASGMDALDALFFRRSIMRMGPQNLHVVLALLRETADVEDALAFSSNTYSNVLVSQIAMRFVSEHRVGERTACIQMMAEVAPNLDACAPMYKISWDDLQLDDPELKGEARPWVPPLIACLMGRRVLDLLADDSDDSDDSDAQSADSHGQAEDPEADYLYRNCSLTSARAALLQIAQVLIMAGASPQAQDLHAGRNSLAWAELFEDDEAQALCSDMAWQPLWQVPVPPAEVDEPAGPPILTWAENLNMNRQMMLHSYGVVERALADLGAPRDDADAPQSGDATSMPN